MFAGIIGWSALLRSFAVLSALRNVYADNLFNRTVSVALNATGTVDVLRPAARCPEMYRCDGGSKLLSLGSDKAKYRVHRYTILRDCVDKCFTNLVINTFATVYKCGPCPNTNVQPADVALVRPDSSVGPIIASVTAYNWRSDQTWPDVNYELPIYKSLDRDTTDFWNYLVDELLLSRVDLVLFHGRGCWDANPGSVNSTMGTGNMCPRLLQGFVDAVGRLGVGSVIRVGMWDDTAAYKPARNFIEGNDPNQNFDVANQNNWKYFWDYNIKIWFDTIPPELWYRLEGKPVIASWNLRSSSFSNQQGNASRLLAFLRDNFSKRYGVEPYFILDQTWMTSDTTITTALAEGQHGWFSPPTRPFTYVAYNNAMWGVAVPGFRDSNTVPGCGVACREVLRRDGKTFDEALQAGSQAKLILLEGQTDMVESAGNYRSSEWLYPCQYLNAIRKYADRNPETLLLQAEGADAFFDTTPTNLGGAYADRALDVAALPADGGWYVGWTVAGEWLQYNQVELGCGLYRFAARLATNTTGTQIRLNLPDVKAANPPNTNNAYVFVLLAELFLVAGSYDLRVVFETGGINLDYFFVKRAKAC